MKELYKFFKFNGKVIDVQNFKKKSLKIYSHKVLESIKKMKQDGKNFYQKQLQKKLKNLNFSDTNSFIAESVMSVL